METSLFHGNAFWISSFFCNSAITLSHNFARLPSQRSLRIFSPPCPSQSLSLAQLAQLSSSSSCNEHLRPTLMSQQHTLLKDPHPRVSASCFDIQVLLPAQPTHCLVQPCLYPHKHGQFFYSFFILNLSISHFWTLASVCPPAWNVRPMYANSLVPLFPQDHSPKITFWGAFPRL